MKPNPQTAPFVLMRKLARERRDKTIAQARTDYDVALGQIAVLEQDLLGRESTRHQKISACIDSVIPRDRPFTIIEVIASLEELDPTRVWRRGSVDNYLGVLRRKKIIQRIRRHRGQEPSIYARVGAEVDRMPFDNMTLPQVIGEVLTEPMTLIELTVRMRQAGYQSKMKNRGLRRAVGEALRNGPYHCEDGKWSPE